MERWWGACVVIRITAPTPAVGSFSDQVLLDLPRRASSTSAFHILLESRVCLRRSRGNSKSFIGTKPQVMVLLWVCRLHFSCGIPAGSFLPIPGSLLSYGLSWEHFLQNHFVPNPHLSVCLEPILQHSWIHEVDNAITSLQIRKLKS